MKIILNIQRFNPADNKAPYYQTYTVEVGVNERLLDALMQAKRFLDGSLGFRKSCAHGVCGSDAMRINGKDGLACKTLIKEVAIKDGDTITLEPLQGLPVQRDLIVDQSRFFEKYRAVKPYLVNDDTDIEKERLQTQEERLRFDDTTNCILCASCYSACPVLETHETFLGPAAIAQAYRFLADTRDKGFMDRLGVLDHPDGVWPCKNHFECTKCCPRSILITKRINQTKKMIEEHRQEKSEG